MSDILERLGQQANERGLAGVVEIDAYAEIKHLRADNDALYAQVARESEKRISLEADNARLLAALKAAEATDRAIRELFELPKDGDLFERIGDWEQDRVVGEVRLQNAVHNVLAEILYENRRKEDGIAVHFLMRLSMLACEARLEGWEKDKPIVAEAIRTLGDPGQANIKEESDTASAAITGAPR